MLASASARTLPPPVGCPLPLLDSDFTALGAELGAPPDAWLQATLRIHDVPHHLEAIAVRLTADGIHRAATPELDARLHGVADPTIGLRWQTVRLRGQDYVLFITPYPA